MINKTGGLGRTFTDAVSVSWLGKLAHSHAQVVCGWNLPKLEMPSSIPTHTPDRFRLRWWTAPVTYRRWCLCHHGSRGKRSTRGHMMLGDHGACTEESRSTRVLAIALALVLLLCAAWHAPAWADSGGYSRPGSFGEAPARRPSTQSSGGYGRPSGSSAAQRQASQSAGDMAISRRNSAQSLQDFRSSVAPPPTGPSGYRQPSDPWASGVLEREPTASRTAGAAW